MTPHAATEPTALFFAAAEALDAYKAVASDEDASEEAVIAARDLAIEALQRCADVGAPVLRWTLIAVDDLDRLKQTARAGWETARVLAVMSGSAASERAAIEALKDLEEETA